MGKVAVCRTCKKTTTNIYTGYECEECYKKNFSRPNMNFEDAPVDVQEEIEKNPILKEVQDLLTTQTAKGLKKYPRTVHVDDYNLTEWIDHVLQEKTDEIVYLVTLKHKIKKVIG